MNNLKDTLVRELTGEKEQILQLLEENDELNYTIQLIEEPGEILITRLISREQIGETVSEAIGELFPGKEVCNVVVADVLLKFKIK